MTIRRAKEGDAAGVAALSTQLGYPSAPGESRRRLAAARSRTDCETLVAELGGSVVGWIHVFVAERIESDPFAEVSGLVVDVSHRGRGVGAALLEAAERWAAAQGCDVMRIRTNVVREEAHHFYEKKGYTRSKQQVVFTKSRQDPEGKHP